MRVFVTGASGWIGTAVVPELLGAGHEVVGLARSDASARALEAAGAEVRRGSLDDLDALGAAAAEAEGVLHLAFKHDLAFSGDYQAAADADRAAIARFGDALAGTGRPLVIASGVAGLAPGRVVTERDRGETEAGGRVASEVAALALADRGVRASSVRLSPTVHGAGDNGFVPTIIGVARERGVSAYVGDGSNRWPAVHRSDAARLFRLALEDAAPGSVLHGVAEEGIAIREVAEVIGRGLSLPVTSVAPDEVDAHFGWIGRFLAADLPASSALTRDQLAWDPTGPGLLEDLAAHYLGDDRA